MIDGPGKKKNSLTVLFCFVWLAFAGGVKKNNILIEIIEKLFALVIVRGVNRERLNSCSAFPNRLQRLVSFVGG